MSRRWLVIMCLAGDGRKICAVRKQIGGCRARGGVGLNDGR